MGRHMEHHFMLFVQHIALLACSPSAFSHGVRERKPQKRNSLRQGKMGKLSSLRYKLCDNFLAEEHRPPGVQRAPSPLREGQDIPCAACGECLRGTRQTDRRQWKHRRFDPPVINFKSFQLGDEEPLGEF